MKTSVSKEELQSRRQFFKSAAKVALPVLGAVVFANLPVQSQARPVCGECGRSCTGTCTGTCSGTCKGSCAGSCSGQVGMNY